MYTYAALVDIGVCEKQNDDRVLIAGKVLEGGTVSGKLEKSECLAAVCDGVGGMAMGYRAAEITLEFMAHLDRAGVEGETVRKAIEEANRRVRAQQLAANLPDSMRTTIAGIYADADRLLVFNAGDSRVYRLRYKYLMQLSKDHSLVQDLVDMGELSREEMRNHPKRNVINKCIGNEESVGARVVDFAEDFVKGDLLLLCSDGITDYLEDARIKEILTQHKAEDDLTVCCKAVFEAAVAAGTQDNMSIIIIRKDV